MGSFLLGCIILVAGILMFGLLIAIHEFGHFFTAKLCGVKVNEFAIGMGPKLWSHAGRETFYSLRLFPIGGYCAMEGEDEDTDDPRSFLKAAAWKKFIILIAGAFMNFMAGLILFLALAAASGSYTAPVVAEFLPQYAPDASPQLQVGDRILSIDGHTIFVASDVSLFFNRGGDSLDMVVLRQGERIALKGCHMPPFWTEDGYKRGIRLEQEPLTLNNVLRQGWGDSVDTVRLVWMSLGDLLTGVVGIRDMSGPVGIVNMMGQVAQKSPSPGIAFGNILYFIAFIAVNLAVMNILPIPALDGGRIFFLAVNLVFTALTGKHLDPKYEGMVNTVCFVALLGLMVVVAASDILKLFGR